MPRACTCSIATAICMLPVSVFMLYCMHAYASTTGIVSRIFYYLAKLKLGQQHFVLYTVYICKKRQTRETLTSKPLIKYILIIN